MNLQLTVLSFCFLAAASRSEILTEKKEKKLLIFKSDVDKIGEDVENFVFDIAKEVIKRTDFFIDPDYGDYEDGESEDTKEAPKYENNVKILKPKSANVIQKSGNLRKITPKALKTAESVDKRDKVRVENITIKTPSRSNTTQTTSTNTTSSKNTIQKENSVKKTTPINENDGHAPKNRYKRSTNPEGPEKVNIPMEEKSLGETNIQTNLCPEKNEVLERRHIEDLKEEVKKLYELVTLLRDQQKILSQLDSESNNIDSDIPKRFSSQDLLRVLEHLNNNDLTDTPSKNGLFWDNQDNKHTEPVEKIIPTHKQLEKLKYELRQAVSTLNKTQDQLKNQKTSEIVLEEELQHQQNELNHLKGMVEDLFQKLTPEQTSDKKNNNTSDAQIVGTALHLPKNMPASKTKDGTRENKLDDRIEKERQNKQRSTSESNRESELDELTRLLNELNKPKENDIESKMIKLQDEIDKKNKEENIKKQLISLKKLLDKQKDISNSGSNEDLMTSKTLQLLVKLMNRPEGKSEDNNVESELRRLQIAIDQLKPKAEFDSFDLSKAEVDQMRDFLNGKGQKSGTNKGNQKPLITPQELIELRKKLDQMTSGGMGNVNSMNTPAAGYGYSNQNIDMRRGFLPYPFLPGYGNFGRMYTPSNSFSYPDISNGYGYDGYQYNNYYSSPLDNKPRGYMENYVPYAYLPPYQQNPGYNGVKNYNAQPSLRDEIANKPFEEYPKPIYTSPHSNTPNEVGNQFFLAPQPNIYDGFESDHIYVPEDINGGNSKQPVPYLPKNIQYNDYKTKSIEELKVQIDSLQSIINNLKYSSSTRRPEDEQIINNLEQQISELKSVVYSMNQAPSNSPTYVQPPVYDQQKNPPFPLTHDNHAINKRSTENNGVPSESKLYDELSTKLKNYLFDEKQSDTREAYGEIENKIAMLKTELDKQVVTRSRMEPYNTHSVFSQNFYNPPHQYNYPGVYQTSFKTVPSKKEDLFTSIIVKIIDKLIAALPVITEKLFGQAFYGVTNVDNSYVSSSDYDVAYGGFNDIQNVLKNFGLIGYVPLIFLKIIYGLNTFVNVLKKNKFFRNFLMPTLVLLLVSGSVLFLVWWLQPEESYSNYKQIGYEDNEKNYDGFGNNNNNYRISKRPNGNINRYFNGNNNHYRNDISNWNGNLPASYSRSYEYN